jgi:hypothetical protein
MVYSNSLRQNQTNETILKYIKSQKKKATSQEMFLHFLHPYSHTIQRFINLPIFMSLPSATGMTDQQKINDMDL